MTVSVIVVAKNQRAFLERSLPVIAAQTGVSGGVETLVVDNDSTDDTPSIVHEHGAQIVPYRPARFNYAEAFNTGAAKAQGRFLVRLSGDAVPLGTDWLRRLIEPMVSDEAVAVTWGSQQLPHGVQNPVEHLCQWLYGYNKPEALPVRVRKTRTVLGCNMATRRNLWAQSPFPAIPQAEDYAFFHAAIRRGFVGTFVPGSVVLHGHEESLLNAVKRSVNQSLLQGMILTGLLP